MGPDPEAEEGDRDRRAGDKLVAENRFARKDRDDLGQDGEGGNRHDVNLRMPKGPEDMLPHDGGAAGHKKEMSPEQAVDQEHDQPRVQDRQRDDDEEGVDENHPGEERQPPQGHVRRATAKDGGDEVNVGADRSDPEDEEGERPVIHSGLRRVGGLTQRRVGEPAHRRRAARQETEVQQNAAKRNEPETKSVQAREGHVARADLERHDIVGQAEEHRHGDEKNHRRAMHGEDHVVGVRLQQGIVRHGQLQPDEQRLDSAEDEEDQPRHHVKNADPLVIDGGEPRHLPMLPLFRRQNPGAIQNGGDLVHFRVSK